MPRALALALGAALAFSAMPASADDGTVAFMQRFSGAWIGSGQVLVGTDTGFEFACTLNGDPDGTKLTFDMRGASLGSVKRVPSA